MGSSDMSIDISNESGVEVDNAALIRLATFALDQLRIHPLAELSILLVDEGTMSAYHEKYLGEPGPTDVLSFPMDELDRKSTRLNSSHLVNSYAVVCLK